MALPDCDELFTRFCAPFYDAEETAARGFTATRPDFEERWKPGTPVDELHEVADEDQRAKVAFQIERMLASARGDWSKYLEVTGEPSLEWVKAFDAYYDREAIQRTIDRSDPSDFSNDYLVLCIQFGVVLGTVLRKTLPRLRWMYNWPYWESAIYDPVKGSRVNVFHWAVKKLSEYGVDDGFADKILACVAILNRP